jgi:hypothetical protein
MVLVEVGIELSAATGFITEELDGIAHVGLNASFLSVLVVLSTRAFANVEKVDHHALGVGVVAIAADIAGRVRTNVVCAGDVLSGQTGWWIPARRTVATAAAVAPLALGSRALRRAKRSVYGHVQSDLVTGLANVGQDHMREAHRGVSSSSANVTRSLSLYQRRQSRQQHS